MKDRTIAFRLLDFCPEDCLDFEIDESCSEYLRFDDGTLVHSERTYRCENEGHCRRLHKQLEIRYCAECRDAMKARGEI